MATKPTSVPVWNTGGANNVEPSAGKKILGWLIGEKPPSSYFNWLQKLYGDWFTWLNSSIVDFGSSSIIVDDLTLTGQVQGLLSVAGDVYVEGEYTHGEFVKNVSPLNFVSDGTWITGTGGGSFADVGYINSSASGRCAIPVDFIAGDRITSLVFARYGDGAADITGVEVYRLQADGTLTDLATGTVTVTDPPASWANTTITVTDTTLAAGDVVYIRFAANAANIRIGSIQVGFTHP